MKFIVEVGLSPSFFNSFKMMLLGISGLAPDITILLDWISNGLIGMSWSLTLIVL